jgi:hypothetical protein
VVVSLNEERAVREANSTLWTPRDAARKLLLDIESGAINPDTMYVCLSENMGDGTDRIYHYCAGAANIKYAGLLTYHLYELAKGGE